MIDFEQGIVFGEDVIRFDGFTCSRCGDVQPSWTRGGSMRIGAAGSHI